MLFFRNKPKFEVFRSDKDNKWYWRLVAGNGKTIAQSEGYNRMRAALAGAELVKGAAAKSKVKVL